MKMTENGWGYLCERSRPERKEILHEYAVNYLEPVLEKFPELKGNVYLALRKKGFFAEYDPVYHIIVPENAQSRYGRHLLMAITAHEAAHLLQFQNDIEKDTQSLWAEIQATMLSWARGFAKDFLLSFPENCVRNTCSKEEKHCYFCCDLLFDGCCQNCSMEEIDRKAVKLELLAKEYGIFDKVDVKEVREKIKSIMFSCAE